MTNNLEQTELRNCEIEFINGKWLVNRKSYQDCNMIEKLAFDEFLTKYRA